MTSTDRQSRWARFTPDPEVAAGFRERGYWRDRRILDHVQSTVASAPDRLAMLDESGQLTYADAYATARRLASWLHAQGVEAGSVVSVQLPNWREYWVVYIACELLGAIVNPLLPMYRANELEHILGTAETRVLIVPGRHQSDDGFMERARWLQDHVASLTSVLVVRPEGAVEPGQTTWDVAVDAAPLALELEAAPSGDAPALVVFTSGTEAKAKGVVHSHNTTVGILEAVAGELSLREQDAVFMPSPLGHGTGLQWGLRMGMFLGSTVVVQDKWDAAIAARMISEHRCALSLSGTPFVRDLVDHVAAAGTTYDLSSFRFFLCGGAPIPRELVTETEATLGCELLACWGQTECWSATQVRPGSDDDAKTSDGSALPGANLRVVDEDGQEVAPGEVGECLVQGPHVMLGYLNPPAGSTFRPGDWHGTGDLVTLARNGTLHVVGRKKEIIIRGGLNISPREVEEALLQHPAVGRVAVVAYDDRRLGERACACVVPRGEPPVLADLTAFLLDRGMAKYKLPERLEIVGELPMTASGKVQRVLLQERLRGATDG
jgi:acyl-CoA synthetase (AMP-forming)/AMP-acid ligase II